MDNEQKIDKFNEPRIDSETKRNQYIKAISNFDLTHKKPEKVLKAYELAKVLKQDTIDVEFLYKYGCPCEYVDDSVIFCGKEKNKLKPQYSNECSHCWLINLTESLKKYNEHPMVQYEKYKSTGLSAEQIEQILTFLGWYNCKDFDVFLQNIKEMYDYFLNE